MPARLCHAACLLALLAACSRFESDAELEDISDRPEQEFLQGTIELFEQERLLGTVEADVIQQFKKENRLLLYGSVHAEDFDSTGSLRSQLDCDTLHVNRVLRDLKAVGNVIVYSSETPSGQGRLRLETDSLEWKNRIQRIRTEADVVFYTEQDTLYGTGFSSDRDLRNWEITKARGVSHRPEGQP